ncbi:hypothetical protein Murru_3203 [Allomuricauda ruestringensis DSM 13258]|uniref:Uncharacterized protein n=1 Tax=Allomuricauda ruestringensis (strain DSM 13258 / CIP 107369 / LMG 19739 / B1) TaxID=886377 RepID=G2PLV4_ALLRU|nr:hypothetical protein Murru_3203 [Allomuricauda ruestringensis DSM 13258]
MCHSSVFGVMLNLPACRQRQVSTSHPVEYEHLYVTLNQVQGDVDNIMTHYGYSINHIYDKT